MALFVSYYVIDENGASGPGYVTIDRRSPPKTPRQVQDLIDFLFKVRPRWQSITLINWIELEEGPVDPPEEN